ncbi:MAG: hypothetical protein PWP61_744 [Trichococcus sp.]|jgi:hypothetical protein|nr:hypothetical protein [Trichococcus sp.]
MQAGLLLYAKTHSDAFIQMGFCKELMKGIRPVGCVCISTLARHLLIDFSL